MVVPTAAYDEIADWYEREFLPSTAAAGADPLGIGAALDALLGRGHGICLEIGCGTGVHAAGGPSAGGGRGGGPGGAPTCPLTRRC